MKSVNEVVDTLESNEDLIGTGTLGDDEFETTETVLTDNAPTASAPTVAVVPVVEHKSTKAKAIFAEMYGKPGVARKDVIKRFVDEAGLTAKGAATYYQNYTKKVKEGKAL